MKWYDLSELKKHQTNHYAQDGEDGLLEYIFKNIKPKSKFAVEFGAGSMNGTPNVRWLVDNFEWKSVMWENKSQKNSPTKKEKYGIAVESVTDENINDLFKKYKVPDDIDLVVIDVDGQDYYMWESLEWKPQVVEIEFNTLLDLDESKVMHRDINHFKWRKHNSSYYGASILALKKLGKKKGYTLIGRCGRNLFFVLNELVDEGYEVKIKDLDFGIVQADEKRIKALVKESWVEV